MQANRFFMLLIVISFFILTLSCETEPTLPVKLYDGPEKTLAELAILQCPYELRVDSRFVSGTVHLLPGNHTIYLSEKESMKARNFLAQAGHKYEVAVYSYSMITVRDSSTAIWGIYDKTDKKWVAP